MYALHAVQLIGNHARVWRRDGKPVMLPWDTLARLLREALDDDDARTVCFIEVFPPINATVDDGVNLRHFWIFPEEVLQAHGAWLP